MFALSYFPSHQEIGIYNCLSGTPETIFTRRRFLEAPRVKRIAPNFAISARNLDEAIAFLVTHRRLADKLFLLLASIA